MEDIRKFVNERVRRKKSEDEPLVGDGGQVISGEYYSAGGKTFKMAKLDKENWEKAKSNSTRGVTEIKAPNQIKKYDLSKDKHSMNAKRLIAKFRTKEDFFVQGRAGWAKTSIIEGIAASFNLYVVTVYLDKALATDLGGIPIPTRTKSGVAQQEYAMPGWAAEMLEHPDRQYLLFFDEMNQAPTDVQNALMPIVLKHEICGVEFDNFFVGAAGNLEEENRGVSPLSTPLKSRFKPIIYWDSDTPAAWDETFEYFHKVWDQTVGPELIERFHDDATLFANPREIEHKIFKFLYKIMSSEGDNSMFDAEYFRDRLINLAYKNESKLTPTEKDKFSRLAEDIADYLASNGESVKPKKKATKNREMLSQDVQDLIYGAMRDGFILLENGDTREKWGVSKENILKMIDPEVANAEQITRYIKKLEAEGMKFYYATNKDIEKDGIKIHPSMK